MKPAKHVPILVLVLCLAAQNATAQTPAMKVEDNSATPNTLLQVNTDAGLLVKGTYGTGVIPATGAGARLMWYPKKAAFRAGDVSGFGSTFWDDVNVGGYSMATGWNTTASGHISTAMGSNTRATGIASTAMGYNAWATGDFATAMGWNTNAGGIHATALGERTTASGQSATAMGIETTASGKGSVVMGTYATAQAYASLVIGRYNINTGDPTNWVPTDPLFVAGNGAGGGSPSNALTLLKNGNLTIAGILTQNSDARLKEDLLPLTGVLSRLEQLQPTYYRFREGTNRPRERQIGLIAQEVEQVFPELVSREADGYLSVSYSNLSAVLIQAVKEQQREIARLEAEVAALRTVMETRLAHVEAVLATPPESGPSTLRKVALSIRQDD